MPSPATVEQKIVSPSNYSSQVEMMDPNVALQERELTGEWTLWNKNVEWH